MYGAKMSKDQKVQKVRFDATRAAAQTYHEGDLVMVLKTDNIASGTSRKLLAKHKGPFRVVKVLLNDRYEVEDLREGLRKKFRTVTAVDKMKHWVTLKGEK